jgi:Na+-transporting NADH:ubiquinone oxidoreductase subunit A
MSKIIKIKKGLDIKLKGKSEKIFIKSELAPSYAIKPIDFNNLVPKLIAKAGDKVKAGSPLFQDKNKPDILFTSPVSGSVSEVRRGERRRILEVVVKPDAEITYEQFQVGDPLKLSRENIIANLLISGCWPYIRQRPFSVIADPKDMPKAIFVSAMNTAPLSPDPDYLVKDREREFQVGIHALSKLTKGKIHVNVDGRFPVSKVYSHAKGIQINKFIGAHPTGNVGVQIHHIDPLNKGEKVWYISPQHIISIGQLFLEGIHNTSKVIALAGPEILKPRYHRIINGTSIANLVQKNIKSDHPRYISGNVFTGQKIVADGHIGFYENMITVIPEGEYYELFGWAMPGFRKYSTSRTFFTWLMTGKKYAIDTNLKGGERAFVMSGQYEKVFPLDIYPVQLIKAIMVEDIDQMEKLGILEVDEEDFALCEFVCTSKINSQEIVRKGLNLILSETV